MARRKSDPVAAAYESALRRFGRRKDVTGVDIGYKIVDGQETNIVAIRIHVTRKRSLKALPDWKRFPRHIGGVPVDVIQAKYEDQNAALRRRVDPAAPGVSIGQGGETGTLGLVVTDNRRAGQPGFLTAAHVLHAGGGSVGDPVFQPSAADGATPVDQVAFISRAHLDSDAVLAVFDSGRAGADRVALSNVTLTTPREPRLNDILEKVGRTSGVTRGRIEGIGSHMGIKDSFRLVGLTATPIAQAGDSGAVWYDPTTGAAVGLHCKGPVTPTATSNFAVAAKLTVVVRKLAVTTIALVALLLSALPAWANQLRVEAATVQRSSDAKVLRVTAQVAWKNAWRNARNHDAVWLVVKLRGNPRGSWVHQRLLRAEAAGTPQGSCTVARDHVGAFCASSSPHRGDVTWQMTFDVEATGLREQDLVAGTVEALVFGVEMVQIPAGPFTIGDPDPKSVERNSFYRSDPQGNYAGTMSIASEDAIAVGRQDGSLFYRGGQYAGDGQGPVPATFPKGTREFYVMKYEVSQGQYTTFLNAIGGESAGFRTPLGMLHYAEQRGSIRIEAGRFVAAAPDRPANYISWDDGCAFADWAGLRPWTELEFTKAARGPVAPQPADFPWGTSSKDRLLRKNQPNDELLQTGDADESRLTDGTRDVLGASFYWVMDLAGSVWEKVVTIGHPRGRAFQGTHGDGRLALYGMATNADWPLGDNEAGGYGYRGGGYYERGSAETDLNPHSRVEQRPYGSWGGGPRSVAYGFRAARSADQ